MAGTLPDPDEVAAIVHATFVEVWWLARFHVGTESEVAAWVTDIAARRIEAHCRLAAAVGRRLGMPFGEDGNRALLEGLLSGPANDLSRV